MLKDIFQIYNLECPVTSGIDSLKVNPSLVKPMPDSTLASEPAPGRELSIDVARGLGIFAVVVGHSTDTQSPVTLWIFAFHMPFFFLLSGYGAKYDGKFWHFTTRRAASLLLPYFTTIVLAFIYWWAFYRHYANDATSSTAMIAAVARQALYATGASVPHLTVGPVGPIWFLPALFAASLTAYLLLWASRGKRGFLFIAFVIQAALIGIVAAKITFLPFSLDLALVAQIFIAFGMLAKEYRILARPPKAAWVLIAALTYLVSTQMGGMSMNDRVYGNPLISFPGAIGGSLIVLWISARAVRCHTVHILLAYLGRAALVILCFHTFDTGFANMDAIFPEFYARVQGDAAVLTIYRLAFCLGLYELIRRVPVLAFLYGTPSPTRQCTPQKTALSEP